MYEKIIEKLLKSIEPKPAGGLLPKFPPDGCKPCIIDAKNFHEIRGTTNKKIAFVDGGNAEIIASANFSLNLIRIGYAVYEGAKKIKTKKFEFIVLVNAESQDDEIQYKSSVFNLNNGIELPEIFFSSFDETLKTGISRADISTVPNAIRRFAELKVAKLISDGKLAHIIVLDGNLQSTLTNENKFLNELYESCRSSEVILAAISKTNSIFTSDGNLLSAVLADIGPGSRWIYHPVAEITSESHKAEMFFARMHEKSKHIFRLEVFKAQKEKAEETISAVAANCRDPVFLGYPYGLVEADRIARVSNREKESLKTMLLLRIKNKDIEKYLSSVNAHQILDRISF